MLNKLKFCLFHVVISFAICQAVANREHFSQNMGQTFIEILDQDVEIDSNSTPNNGDNTNQKNNINHISPQPVPAPSQSADYDNKKEENINDGRHLIEFANLSSNTERSMVPPEMVPAPKVDEFDLDLSTPCKIQDIINTHKSEPLVGLEYLVEIIQNNESHQPRYKCVLCSSSLLIYAVMDHLTCIGHKMRYLCRHFRTLYNEVEKFESMRTLYRVKVDKVCRAIESYFGRMHPVKYSQIHFEFYNAAICRAVTRREHFCASKLPQTFGLSEIMDSTENDHTATGDGESNNAEQENEVTTTKSNTETATVPEACDGALEVGSSGIPDQSPRDIGRGSYLHDNKERRSYRRSGYCVEPNYTSRDDRDETGHLDRLDGTDREYKLERSRPRRRTRSPIQFNKLTTQQRHDIPMENLIKYKKEKKDELKQSLEMLVYHGQNLEEHPHYCEELLKFEEKNVDKVKTDQFQSNWTVFWRKRMMEMHEEKIELIKKLLRKKFDFPMDKSPTRDLSFNNRRSPPHKDRVRSRSPRQRPRLAGRRSRSPVQRRQSPLPFRTSPRRHSPPHRLRRLSPRPRRPVSTRRDIEERPRLKSREDNKRTSSRDEIISSKVMNAYESSIQNKTIRSSRSRSSDRSASLPSPTCSLQTISSDGDLSPNTLSDVDSDDITTQQPKKEVTSLPTVAAPSQPASKSAESKKEKQINKLQEFRERTQEDCLLNEHLKHPEKHPQYHQEWQKFWTRRYNEVKAKNKDPATYDFKSEWIVYWTKRMIELYEDEMKDKATMLQKQFDFSLEDSPPRDLSTKVTSNQEIAPPQTQMSQSRSLKRRSSLVDQIRSHSPVSRRSPGRSSTKTHKPTQLGTQEISRQSDNKDIIDSTSLNVRHDKSKEKMKKCPQPIHDYMTSIVLSDESSEDVETTECITTSNSDETSQKCVGLRPTTRPGGSSTGQLSSYEAPRKSEEVLSVLRQLVALEDYLGPNLGPLVLNLLRDALRMEKVKKSSSDNILDVERNFMLLEMVKEKLMGKVEVGLLGSATPAVQEVISRTSTLLDRVQTPKTKPMKKEPVREVCGVNRALLKKQVAKTVLAKGNTDMTAEELASIVDGVISMAEAKRYTTDTSDHHYCQHRKTKERSLCPKLYDMVGLSDCDLNTFMEDSELPSDEEGGLADFNRRLETQNLQRPNFAKLVSAKTPPAPPNIAMLGDTLIEMAAYLSKSKES